MAFKHRASICRLRQDLHDLQGSSGRQRPLMRILEMVKASLVLQKSH